MNVQVKLCCVVLSAIIVAACASEPKDRAEPSVGEMLEGAGLQPSEFVVFVDDESEADLVCRFEKTVNSRIGKRICRTKAQLIADREEAKAAIEANAYRTNEDRVVRGN